jgi:hypothetical protein
MCIFPRFQKNEIDLCYPSGVLDFPKTAGGTALGRLYDRFLPGLTCPKVGLSFDETVFRLSPRRVFDGEGGSYNKD